jgi:hypothetical protein
MVAAAAAVLAALGALAAQVDAAAGGKASAGRGSSSIDTAVTTCGAHPFESSSSCSS